MSSAEWKFPSIIDERSRITMFSYVIFDLDGTLLNTLEDLADAGNWVCQKRGWPTHTLDEYRYFVGNGMQKLVERFSPEYARSFE